MGLGTTVWWSVRGMVCAATATAPCSHGASGPNVPAASPPVVISSLRAGSSRTLDWRNPRRRRWKMLYFLLKRDGLLC